jgi:hypothetical protein
MSNGMERMSKEMVIIIEGLYLIFGKCTSKKFACKNLVFYLYFLER